MYESCIDIVYLIMQA